MSTVTATSTSGTGSGSQTPAAVRRRPRREGRQGLWGWAFVSPMVVVLGLFLALPVVMALWVSLLDWDGQSNPFSGAADFVGLANYKGLFADQGLTRTLFMTSLRNNLYYVLLVVPCRRRSRWAWLSPSTSGASKARAPSARRSTSRPSPAPSPCPRCSSSCSRAAEPSTTC